MARIDVSRLSTGVPTTYLQYGGLVLTFCCVTIFLFTRYVLEGSALMRRYGNGFRSMDDTRKRSFIAMCTELCCKIVVTALAVQPAMAVATGYATFQTPLFFSKSFTTGDLFFLCIEFGVAAFISEMFSLPPSKLKLEIVVHHIAAFAVAQAAVTLPLFEDYQEDGVIILYLAFLYEYLTCAVELVPDCFEVARRLYREQHDAMRKFSCVAFFSGVVGYTFRFVYFIWLIGGIWSRWYLSVQLALVVVLVAFTVPQVLYVRDLHRLWRRQVAQCRDDRTEVACAIPGLWTGDAQCRDDRTEDASSITGLWTSDLSLEGSRSRTRFGTFRTDAVQNWLQQRLSK